MRCELRENAVNVCEQLNFLVDKRSFAALGYCNMFSRMTLSTHDSNVVRLASSRGNEFSKYESSASSSGPKAFDATRAVKYRRR